MKPYMIAHPRQMTNGIVFNSPHSGTRFPDEFLGLVQPDETLLERSGDTLVDQLIHRVCQHNATLFTNLYARSYVDTNRAPDEMDPDMFTNIPPETRFQKSDKVLRGFGAIPRKVYDGTDIYREPLSYDRALARMAEIYHPVHDALSGLLEEIRSQTGYYLLVDCHSMPSYNFMQSSLPAHTQPDVILGNNFNKSCHRKISAFMEGHFKDHGLRVAFNSPYAGGYNTVHYGSPSERKHTIQIEVNRNLYIDEASLKPHEGFAQLQAIFTELAQKLDQDIRNLL